jgi:cation transporter-like permease
MDNSSLSFRESVFLLLMLMLTGGFIACSVALHAIAANLPYLILALVGSGCLVAFTVTKCAVMLTEAKRPRYYLDNRDYDSIEAGCREVKPVRGLLGRGRR